MDDRRCCKCGLLKPVQSFHKDRTKPLGRRYDCKECAKEWQKANRIGRYKNNELRKLSHSKYRSSHRTQERSRAALRNAVRDGRVAKPDRCVSCSTPSPLLHGHHHNGYDKPLDVQWLCAGCHGERHVAG